MKIPVIAVLGPTAAGKTALGIDIAKEFNGEIISADSMQIYKGMNIASAKPSEEEKEGIPHHLMDFLSPLETYSAADFVKDAGEAVKDIRSRGKMPVIVGGTGLYINSLLDNITFSKSRRDEKYRQELYKKAEEEGNESVYSLLLEVDPDYAKNLHPNNLGRVIRALELYKTEGITMSRQIAESRLTPSPFNDVRIGITYKDREKLYERINLRVDKMFDMGLLDEADNFLKSFPSKTSLQAIGIKELIPYFEGEASLDECKEKLKQATRNYAKRQLTWFRKDEKVFWIYADNMGRKEIAQKACRHIREEGLLWEKEE